ncbi:MAG TPA: UDP-glucose--hexose-1-phosphate uridylyltransferase [Vicinamibacterales bacterium]|nr:UDP-glucose--hexose-1-phosphate uridylyltransferase [Vicinamibacterales bacterium]
MPEYPHRRFNPLRGEWVLVSPQRTDRPWQGQTESAARAGVPAHDPNCYLCPGSARAGGVRNPQYASTFAFDNDFPALVPDSPERQASAERNLFVSEPERGLCRVICFSPRHDLTLSRMDAASVRAVVDAWVDECRAAAARPWVKYALVFENRGEMMGASNPHPHCQLWATEHVPGEPARERTAFGAYADAHRGACLLCDYLSRELGVRERIVCENDRFVAVVPFWATWPFETLVMSRRHTPLVASLDDRERDALSHVLGRLTRQYDALFDAPFPYSMGFHQAPVNDGAVEGWHLHAHVYPPLLRSATIRKFIVGFELLGSPQRDLTPEDAAARLRGEVR